ncbi:MAG: sugar phosphate nucleotidyltransferase [Candidatus Pacearchaeota archaeon]|jgi:glucose-1-phosphate cytidylyltransferase
MKAVILCGGKGRRLNESTEYMPKPLVEVGGKPLLWHIIKIYAYQGVKDFILCLGYKGDMIKDYFLRLEEMSNDFILDLRKNKIYHFSDSDELDVTISFIDTGDESMTGSRIARIKKYIGDDEDFFMTYGDGVADVNLKALYEHHKKNGKIVTLTAVHPVYRYGLVELQEDLITSFDEKPNMKDFINGGFMVLNKKIFNYLSEDEKCILEQEPLRNLARDHQLSGFIHKGFWNAVDTQKDLDELEKVYKQGAPWMIWRRINWLANKDSLKKTDERWLNCEGKLLEDFSQKRVDELNKIHEQGFFERYKDE